MTIKSTINQYAIVLGTRPEIIKLSPIIRRLIIRKIPFTLIHTNQHYSTELDKIFFEELDIPPPHHNLLVGSHSHGKQTGLMLEKIEEILIEESPKYVIVQGDTNSTLSGALAASKIGIKIIHIEAGLRSYDRQMPEEINRILVDHISDFLFVPTDIQKQILIGEGIQEEIIHVVGNTIVDSLRYNIDKSNARSNILNKLNLKSKNYLLLTLHRPSNVDDKKQLSDIIIGLDDFIENYDQEIIFPIHPRTAKKIEQYGLTLNPQIRVIKPVGYFDMIQLISQSRLVITDSGGLQEESCILNVPTLTLRDNTERPETIQIGANFLIGDDYSKMTERIAYFEKNSKRWIHPYGENVADKIINTIECL